MSPFFKRSIRSTAISTSLTRPLRSNPRTRRSIHAMCRQSARHMPLWCLRRRLAQSARTAYTCPVDRNRSSRRSNARRASLTRNSSRSWSPPLPPWPLSPTCVAYRLYASLECVVLGAPGTGEEDEEGAVEEAGSNEPSEPALEPEVPDDTVASGPTPAMSVRVQESAAAMSARRFASRWMSLSTTSSSARRLSATDASRLGRS